MLVPKLRFKEFKNTYSTDNIGNLCKIQTGKSNTQDKVNNGIYPFYVRFAIIEHSNKYIFDCEAVLTVGDGVGTGKVYHYINGKFDCHQRVYVMNNFKNISGKYFYYIFSKDFHKRVQTMTAKTSVDSVRFEMIDKMNIFYPEFKEQNKVANFLSLLDKKIELQTKKIEVLKLYKKGLSKIIFTNNVNDTVKLKDISNIYKGKQINKENMMDFGPYYVLNGGINISGYTDSYNENENTISISEGGNSCGYVNFNKVKYWSGGHCYSINPKEKVILNNYLFQLLKYNEPRIMDLRIGSGLPNIQKKSLENYSVNIHILSYQYIIGKQLTNFDNKIEFESYKLNKLERLKKGLMQNMFV